jgi:hypothetical protein
MKRIFVALALTFSAPAHADIPPPPVPAPATPAPAPPPTPAPTPAPLADTKPVQAFGDEHPSCAEWTDGCIVCKRQSDETVACSLVGIACVAAAAICSKTTQ